MVLATVRAVAAIAFGATLFTTAALGLGIGEGTRPTIADHDDVLVAQVREDAGSSIVTVEPPRQEDYHFTAILEGGVTTMTGFVPDDTIRKELAATARMNTDGLTLARGEPTGFAEGIDFGLAVLARMSEGRFEFRDGTITLEGRAATAADFSIIEATPKPQGFDLAMGGVRPPLADPFVWSAEKGGEGGIRFSGFVPSEAVRSRLTEAAVAVTADTANAADGAPEGFEASAVAGLSVLAKLPSGALRFDGETWTIEAVAETPAQGAEARTAFDAAGLDGSGWIYAVTSPPEPPPAIADYSWSAEKLPSGAIALTGYVPNDGLRRVMIIRTGEQATDELTLGTGAPETFPIDSLAAIDALKLLDEGRAAFAEGAWSIIGRSEDPAAPAAVTAALGERADTWQIAVTAPAPLPPLADPFVWSATKAADGSISFAGYVATDALKRVAGIRADAVADSTEIASGAPDGFVGDVLAAIDALAPLESGEVRFDGSAWSLTGKPATVPARDSSLAALNAATTPAAQWTVTLEEPPPAPVEVAAADPNAALETPAPLEVPAIEAEPEVAAVPAVEAPAESEAAAETAETEVAEPETPAETEVAAVASDAVESPTVETPEAAVVAIPPRVVFDATRVDGNPIILTGEVSSEPARAFFGVIAGEVSTDGMTVGDDLPADFIPNADAGLRILTSLYDGRLAYDGSHWYLTGTANTEAERAAIADQALITLPPSGQWVTGIGVTPPIKLCRITVAGFAAQSPILFQSGSARMTDESMASLGELATDLQFCPDTAVYVEGHTDADGPDDLNLALSVARAEAVVDALVGLGVGYQRLYAVGYGESLPIADNETQAGKRANRRIVFTILDGEEE